MASIEKRKNGSYRIIVSNGYDKLGRQIKEALTISQEELKGLTELQLEKELNTQAVLFEQKVKNGIFLDGERITLEEFTDKWLTEHVEKQLTPSTIKSYKAKIEKRIVPAMGHLKLAKIQPHHLMEFYNNLGEKGIRLDAYYKPTALLLSLLDNARGKDIDVSCKTLIRLKNGMQTNYEVATKISAHFDKKLSLLFTTENKSTNLSNKTIKHYHDLLSSIFSTAVEWNVIVSNPVDRVKPPKVQKKKAAYYEEMEVVKMLMMLENEPLKYKAAVHLAVDTGIRIGELVGLEWSDISFERNRITINKQRQYVHGYGVITKAPKTDSGERHITVSDMVMRLLHKYQIEQKENQLKMGNLWTSSKNVFIHEDGAPMHPHRPYTWFVEFLQRHNLPKITFHQLRHTNASLLIAQGIDIVTLSGRLGHADKNVTLNSYSHIISSKEEQAANKMNDFYKQYM